MREPNGVNLPAIKCPRCGYDLRGTVATWTNLESWPMEGTCTECGLEFLWRDVMRVDFGQPQWCVEYAPAQLRPLREAVVATYVRSWMPWRFWSRLQMHHRARPQRLALYLLVIVFFPLLVMYLATQTLAALLVHRDAMALVAADVPPTEADLQALQGRVDAWAIYEKFGDLPETEKTHALEMVRRMTGGRGATPQAHDLEAFSRQQWELIRFNMHQDLQRQWLVMLSTLQVPSEVRMGLMEAIGEAIFRPHATQSSGTIVFRGAPLPYCPPREIHFRALRAPTSPLMALALVAPAAWIFVLIAFPFSLALLITTRRRAKVRWVHLLRPTVYGFAIPMTALILAYILFFLPLVWPRMVNVEGLVAFVTLVVTPAALFAWWYFAIKRHLKLRHALAVTGVMMLLCTLGFLVTIRLTFGRL